MNDAIKLEPCPFCGGPAEIRKSHEYSDWEVTICCAEENRCYIHPETDRYPDETYELALKGAAKEWNTRSTKIVGKRELNTPYLKLKKSLYDVIQMACSMCKTKHCQSGFTECSGIAEAKEALAEPPRNCDVEETYRDASCQYLKTHPEVNQNVSSWGWENWYDFALWVFKRQKENKVHEDNRT